ncbi:MAG: ATP-dependent DNA helicase [Thermoplasmata archaeon]
MRNYLDQPMHELFPYELRKNQNKIMDNVQECLKKGKSMVYQAATGSGKTVCSLAPVLKYADDNNKKILYLTRTNSQQRQVLLELRNIGGFYGMGIQGRNNTCLLAQHDEELQEGSAEELSQYCSDRKKEVRQAIDEGKEPTSCPYYGGLLECDIEEMREYTSKNVPTVDEFMDFCAEREICAYELAKALIPDASLVTAPYIYFFVPFIRKRLTEWMNVELDDLIVIIDEAHNLPDYARDLSSAEITDITLERAMTESSNFGDPELYEDTTINSFIRLFKNILLDIVDEFVVEDDGLIPPSELKSELLYSLGMNTNELKGVIKDLKVQGQIVQEKKREEKKLPRSYINSLASFLSSWFSIKGQDYIKLVNGGDNPSLEAFCLDPSNVTGIVNSCHSSIHQSATLEPLDEYKDSIGLPYDTEAKIYPSPFSEENNITFYTDGVTTKYETLKQSDDMLNEIRNHLKKIIKDVDRNLIIFFPSYRLMNNIIRPISHEINSLHSEQQEMDQPELMSMVNDFKNHGGVLTCVIGGRISEGMDFPGEQLEVAVVVGIPYPKPTARQKGLQHYYNMKFNKGWEYTVKAPAVRKILQATGRLVRSENDLGASLILDERAIHFKKYLHELKLVDYPAEAINEFFEEKEQDL